MNMENTLARLGSDREAILRELERNTEQMRWVSAEAIAKGYKAPTIAKHLGVTKRTVYLWNK